MTDHYQQYLSKQREWSSDESSNQIFTEGQRRFIDMSFHDTDRNMKILDVGCGCGVGLKTFKEMGFFYVVGIDLVEDKLALASQYGYPVFQCDFHKISFPDSSFDIVYSSHSLEHAYDPEKVVREAKRVLVKGGNLLVVLPYPDVGDWNNDVHVGKVKLGTNMLDEGKSVVEFFAREGFNLVKVGLDSYREPEIWIHLQT